MKKPEGKMSVLIAQAYKKKNGLGGADDAEESSPDMESEGDDKADMALSDLAELIGLPEDKIDDFKSCFKSAVKACKGDSEEESSDLPL